MRKNYFFGLLIAMLAIILPTKSVFAQETVVEPEVTYTLTTERLSASDLMAATEPVYIAIKNVSATNNYYYVGNTGGVPYSKPEFSDDAVFVWEPMVAGVAGTAYVLKKLDGTVMTSTSPTTFSADSGAGAVFVATNPTEANGEFNGDSDSQSYIDDQSLLVRFVVGGTTGTTWINVQNGDNGVPVYNSGKGGWTVHNVYKVAKEQEEVVAPSYKATVSVNDETMGTATVEVVDGVATFTATANEGYKFVTWMLESDGELMDTGNTTNPLTLTLDADYALQAKFEAEAVVEPEVVWYRLKETTRNEYMNVFSYDPSAETNAKGLVNIAPYADSKDQIFALEEAEVEGQYYLRTEDYYYVTLAAWNVNVSPNAKNAIIFEETATSDIYILRDPSKPSNKNYLKIGGVNVGDGAYSNEYYVYCDAAVNDAAQWLLEKVEDEVVEPEPSTPFEWASKTDVMVPAEGYYQEIIGTMYTLTADVQMAADATVEVPSTLEFGIAYHSRRYDLSIYDWVEEPYYSVDWYNGTRGGNSYTALNLTISEDGNSATMEIEKSFIGSGLYMYDAEGTKNPLTLTVNADGTISMSDYMVMDADGFEVAKYTNVKLTKKSVEVVPPAEPDAEVVAEVEALLALNGVGYPNATENATLKAALDAYTSNVSDETLAALNAAVEAFYATTNITLPESGKYYTMTAVAPNGNELYIDYNGTELVLVERTADTVLPESAKFKFESNADGSYRVWATEDLYLVYSHGENSNISWMTGASKTGIQDKNNATALTEMGNITFSKFSYTAEAEDIFGLVQWSSYRGFKTETNALEPGVLVIKHSASDFDGANATFFNENFTSALRLEEAEVAAPAELTVEKVTPDTPVASLETIEIEFSDVTIVKVPNSTTVKDATGADVGWFMSREIDGKVQRLTLMPAITTPGTYTLTIPADVIKNEAGVFYAGGTFEFTVEAAPAVETFAVSAVLFPVPDDPAKVTEIKAIRVQHEMGASIAELPTAWTLTDADNKAVEVNVQWGLSDFNDIMIMPTEPIKTSGTYTLNIPAGSLKTEDGKEVEAATFSFTVVGEPVAPTGYEYFEGVNGHAARALESFIIGTLDDDYAFTDNKLAVNDIQSSGKGSNIFVDKTDNVLEVKAGDVIGFEAFLFHGEWMHAYAYIDYNNDFVFGTDLNPYGETNGELVSYNYLGGVDSHGNSSSAQYANRNKYSDVSAGLPAFFLPEGIAPGEYRMRIKIDYDRVDPNFGDDWADNNPPKIMGGCQCDFTIKVVGDEPVKEYLEIADVTPASGTTVDKLEYILVTFGPDDYVMNNIHGVDVMGADGVKVGYADIVFKKEDGSTVAGNELVLKLQEAIAETGTYTITLPEGAFGDGIKNTAERTLTFTVDPTTGIDGVDAEVEQVIYDITGRRIEKITNAGVYIVNGVKVLVK